MNKDIKDLTELELLEIQKLSYEQIMQAQGNNIAIQNEVARRKGLIKPEKKE